MTIQILEDIPHFDPRMIDIEVKALGEQCVIRTSDFLAKCSLATGELEWVANRNAPWICNSSDDIGLEPKLRLQDTKLWISSKDSIVAELYLDSANSVILSARCSDSGRSLWDFRLEIPNPASWAEKKPAWPGAPTEELYAFLAQSEENLVLCLFRQTRCSGMSTPDFQVRDVPEYRCQLDSCCFEPRTGSLLWSESHLELKVGILERRNFRGAWANGNTIGLLDFSTGTVLTLSQERNTFGVPVHAGERCYFPWFANKDKCVGYVETGVELSIESQYGWPEKGVRDVTVWPFASGVGLQLNNQKMLWTQSGELKWIQRAKPYIYKVFATDESDIFVATDGNGGRLLGFSRDDGSETFNFRPAIGGVGSARYVSEVKCIVANVAMKKSYDTAPKLMLFDIEGKTTEYVDDCWRILAAWDRGVVFVTGAKQRKVAFLVLE